MESKLIRFSKYDDWGAYHWAECDLNSSRYNPPLVARYSAVAKRVDGTERVLDVGCGDGYLMNLVSPLCNEVTGVEFEWTGATLASKRLKSFPNCSVGQGSCYSLPFVKDAFDLVILADVIEHLQTPEDCLKEINRVLKPTGTLLVTTPKRNPNRPLGWGHVREYVPEELTDSLQAYFSRVKMTFLWPATWFRMYRTRVGWRLIRVFARYFYNPFVQEGDDPTDYDQILAICENPRR